MKPLYFYQCEKCNEDNIDKAEHGEVVICPHCQNKHIAIIKN